MTVVDARLRAAGAAASLHNAAAAVAAQPFTPMHSPSSSRLLPLVSLVAAALLAACAAPPPAPAAAVAAAAPAVPLPPPAAAKPPPDPKVLGLWKIEQARAAPLLHKLNARLDFGADGRLSGNGGCNSLSASYALAASDLKLGPVASTRMACNDALMEQEDRVLSALERATRARVPGHGLLELLDDQGTVLLRGSRLP